MAVGNLEFIKSASGTSVVSVDVTDCFSDKYDVYQVLITKSDVSAQDYSVLRLIDSGGSVISANEYDYAELGLLAYTTFGQNKGTGVTSFPKVDVSGTSTAQGIGTMIYVFNPYDSSSYTFVAGQYSGVVAAGLAGGKHIGVHKVAEQITGIQLLRNNLNGVYDNLTVNVFGVK